MMKQVLSIFLLLVISCLCVSAGTVTLGTFSVNSQSSFLYEDSTDSQIGPLFIDLSCTTGVTTNCVNAPAGSTLQLIGLGGLCFFTFQNGACPGGESPAFLGGAFDSNTSLLASSSLNPATSVNRLTGSINAGVPNVSQTYLRTFYGNVDTTIPNDFFIPTGLGLTIVVPAGAQYLVVGVLDSLYSDNTGNLSVEINQITSSVPEPATFGLLAAGLGGLALLQRRRRSLRDTQADGTRSVFICSRALNNCSSRSVRWSNS